MPPLVYGLDFGTTNSVISVLEGGPTRAGAPNGGAPVRVLPIGLAGQNSIPSLLFFPTDITPSSPRKHWVGDAALAKYLDSGLRGRLMQSIKMFLPDDTFKGTKIHNIGHCTLEHLVALMLREIKERADRLVGQDVRAVVLGRPGRFSADDEEERTAERRLFAAAREAGFEQIRFQREPAAAAFFYETTLTHPELALVADLGGGTSDFTIVRLAPGAARDHARRHDRAGDILGTRSVSYAGDEIDTDIMLGKLTKYFGGRTRYEANPGQWLEIPAHLMQTICRWREIPFLRERRTRAFIDRVLYSAEDKDAIRCLRCIVEEDIGFSLFQAVEHAKCALAEQELATINFNKSLIKIRSRLTREQFSLIMQRRGLPLIEGCIDRLLQDCALTPGQIDSVFLTGGTSKVGVIQELLARKFGAEKLKPGDAFISVAAGLALSAPMLFAEDEI